MEPQKKTNLHILKTSDPIKGRIESVNEICFADPIYMLPLLEAMIEYFASCEDDPQADTIGQKLQETYWWIEQWCDQFEDYQ